MAATYSMIEILLQAAALRLNRVRVNDVEESMRDGVTVFTKHRRPRAATVAWFANRFMQLSGSGVCMFIRTSKWIEWEIYCAELLHPEQPPVMAASRRAVTIPKVYGVSLRELLRSESREAHKAFAAAGGEVRRVHHIHCGRYRSGWSHGDLHLDNILYDPAADRAALIDFDMRHRFRVSEAQRQSEDLMVVLLELLGMPDDRWMPLATAFIEAYGDGDVLLELRRQLRVPEGFARLLYYIRTNGSPLDRTAPRLHRLREMIDRARVAPGAQPAQLRPKPS